MKKFLSLVFLLVFAVSTAVLAQKAPSAPKTPTGVRVSLDFMVAYTLFESRPVYLLVDHNTNRVILKMKLQENDDPIRDGRFLAFLKQEVLRFWEPGKATPLGNNGHVFTFIGGRPAWDPYTEMGQDGTYKCLHFANNASVDGKNISGRGENKTVGYYGYDGKMYK